jgi:hypothetical protein
MKNTFMTIATRETPSEILEHGGTGTWRVRPASVHDTEYIIICARPRPDDSLEREFLGIEPYSAFFIGKISGLMGTEGRYRIMISDIASIKIDDAWVKGSRFNFLYSLTDGLKGQIDLKALDWTPVPAGMFA